MLPSSLRFLVCAGIVASGLAALGRDAAGQAMPEDEPMPPAMGRPTAPPPPPAPSTSPPPAAPAPAPAPPPARPPEAAPPPSALTPPTTPASPSAAASLEATSPRLPGTVGGRRAAGDPDSYLTSLTGQIGLYHLSTAEVGPAGHLRFGLHGQYFRSTGFLLQEMDGSGDTNTRFSGSFTFGFTPHESVELFGGIMSSSNRNTRAAEENRTDPVLIKSFGDLVLGGKAVAPVSPGFSAGAELGFRFLSGISDLSVSPSSTSLWIGPVATLDLQRLAQLALRLHANISYYLDNSGNLYDFSGRSLNTQEVAMFAYGIQGSRLRFALGVDAPLERYTGSVPLRPFVEYHAEIVTASADPAFANLPGDTHNRDQHWVTLGLRARVFKGLTVDAGVDLGLRSVGFQYGTPLPPYDMIFGIGYPFDTAAFGRPTVVTRTVEKTPPPATGTVVGTVKNKADGKPVAEAVVSFAGQPRARVATDPDGSFQSIPLPPGPADITVAAAGYEPATGKANVVVGSAATVEVALVARVLNGNVRGKVADRAGRAMAATIRFHGSSNFEARTDGGGTFSAALPAGPYQVTVEATGYPSRAVSLDVAAGRDQQLDVTLRPANPDVTLTLQAIVLRVPIKFKAGTPKLPPPVKAELEGVADILADHPEIKTLRIEAHWSGAARGKGGASAKTLTEKQAAAIKDFLVSKGASADRIETVGVGGEAPLVPNLGPANQAKNRRVELVVVQQ
ncbi:MAG TPA: OmpA family protein [Polyangia bacterium]|jgi:outer membrane protein OmpA-like peptidoglycan-associated protein